MSCHWCCRPGAPQVVQQLEEEKKRTEGVFSELQSGRQQLAALRAENGALKQQKAQLSQKDKQAAEEQLAAAQVHTTPTCPPAELPSSCAKSSSLS